jgi:hypothetical protein
MLRDDCEGKSEGIGFDLIRRAGVAMGNLASTYYALGKRADALAMEERVLEFRRRVLPADHPDIGEGCVVRDALYVV